MPQVSGNWIDKAEGQITDAEQSVYPSLFFARSVGLRMVERYQASPQLGSRDCSVDLDYAEEHPHQTDKKIVAHVQKLCGARQWCDSCARDIFFSSFRSNSRRVSK